MPGPLPADGFDLDAALKSLEHYCRATGVGAHLLGSEGRLLGRYDAAGGRLVGEEPGSLCPVCALQGEAERAEELRVQLFSAFQAERFGGEYIQLCPHALLFWTAPIVVEGIMRAAYVGGPVLVVDPAEICEELLGSGRVQPDRRDELGALLAAVSRVSTSRAGSLAALLAELARALASASGLGEARERVAQQARISEYIHELKAGSVSPSPPYPLEKERELLHAISQGDKGESQRLLNEILGHVFFSSGQDPEQVRERVLELVVLLSRAALEGGADIEQIFGLNFTYLSQLQRMRSIEDIAHWLSRIMIRFTELVFDLRNVKHADTLQKALRYINAHYAEELTLDDVAGAVFLSPTYFSKLFNAEMKCRFTVYLNRVRIEKSRLLLRNTDIPLVDIAGMVGYEDQSYFTKVFKKTIGTSPGRYRESGGRGGSSEEIHGS